MKSFIQKTLLGVLIAPFIAMSVSLVMPVGASAKAVDPCTTNTISGGIGGGAKCAKGDNTQSDLFGNSGLFKKIVNILLFLIGAIAVIMIVIGGIRYVVSGGDSGAVTGAKNTILYAVVGIIVAVLAYAIVNFVITNVK